MNQNLAASITLLLSGVLGGYAQSLNFADDALGRGYVERPYLRYEAEDGHCRTQGVTFIESRAKYDQNDLSSEASNLEAAQLTAAGSSVSWTLDRDANALTIRFSLPDTPDGSGTRQVLEIRDGDTKVADVELDSYFAWQYTVKAYSPEKYPDNTPDNSKFARMRFDEVNVLLPATIQSGSTLSLVKADGSADPITIDFVEAELATPLTPEDFPGCVVFDSEKSSLPAFISQNAGKTIFIPAGTYNLANVLDLNQDNIHVTGAGMWFTTINFTANPDKKQTYFRRGVKSNKNNVTLENLSLTTLNNRRYYDYKSLQMGKGLSGSWGKNSTIRNVRADHFECGAWIADYEGNPTDGLLVEGCRFRNNFADGINLCSGSQNITVRNCSFRNNGDDDMASWSSDKTSMVSNITFDHCTAENNWRASSLAFYGGQGHKATNIAIYDGMECGAHVNGEFDGSGFGNTGEILLQNISIRRCGAMVGPTGTQGDFWGNPNPGVDIRAGWFYDVINLTLRDILVEGSRFESFRVASKNGKNMTNLKMHNLTVVNQDNNEWHFNFQNGLKGNGEGSNFVSVDEPGQAPFMSPVPDSFNFTYTSGIRDLTAEEAVNIRAEGLTVTMAANASGCAVICDLQGRVLTVLTAGKSYTSPAPTMVIAKSAGLAPRKFYLN